MKKIIIFQTRHIILYSTYYGKKQERIIIYSQKKKFFMTLEIIEVLSRRAYTVMKILLSDFDQTLILFIRLQPNTTVYVLYGVQLYRQVALNIRNFV